MCKTELTKLIEFGKLSAITPEERAFVIEACLGYYILNEPPKELLDIVCRVSSMFIALLEKQDINYVTAARYICSTQGKFYGVLEEPPGDNDKVARDQMLRALTSPSIAVQLNAHRTLVVQIAGISTYRVRSGPTNRKLKPLGSPGTQTDRYGAVGLMGGIVLAPTTQVHIPASSFNTTIGPVNPNNMPAVSGQSGTAEKFLQVAGWLNLSRSEQRWYCLGILGFLLAPGAHSLYEVARTVACNDIAEYMPRYRYCGFLSFEMQRAPWYKPMLQKFGSAMRFGYWGDLELVCYELVKSDKLSHELWELVFTFLDLPFLTPDLWSTKLKEIIS